ncbi:hypothetical protein A2Y85_08630 [candidate division WOR-3 bacterium RBG_13_43_14]|uniref:ABC transporter substrate-binding protein n=1 Tax=candidate division WOR-3 bacterium RBG_13_43_14 TaxID=1802590 RepID=A0A1F4U1W0_UNCW3|nr:MAG: hypothetical protein A2Y85_08630 [candidate division WOR-3 bacterium RBG_13_43_14]
MVKRGQVLPRISFSFLILLAITLTVCSNRSSKKVAVDFWHVMSGPLGRRLDEMIDEFNALHPAGRIVSVHMGSYDALVQKLMGAVASNNPPVIAQMYESWTDQFYEAGFLYPLEDFVKVDPGFALDDFFPVFIEDNTYNNKLVTLPFNKSIPVFYYNQDLIEQYGFQDFPENWEDFRKLCDTLRYSGVWPTSWPIDVWYFSTLLYQHGGALLDETGNPQFHDDAGIRVLEYIVDLVKDSLLYLNPGFQRQNEFLSGRVAIIPASVVSWAFVKDRPGFRMGVRPFPNGPRSATVIAGTNIGMFARSSNDQKNLAWQFIRWFLQAENQMRWTEASYYLPTRQSVRDLPAYHDFVSKNPGYAQIVDQLEYANTEPKTQIWFTGRIYLNEALEEAIRLERTPEQALNYAARRISVEQQ